MGEYDLTTFYRGLEDLQISLSDAQMEQFLHYYKLLIEWNKVMNLTGITEFSQVIEKHFLDSLCLVKAVPHLADQRVLDLGTGAGFPGIPLKIAFPQLDIVLADSLKKRLTFLDEVISTLGLTKVVTVHGRAEELARLPKYRQQFDYCVSRAVSNLAVLSEYSLPFVKLGGFFVPYKSGEVDQELEEAKKAIHLLGGTCEEVVRYAVPGSDQRRTLLLIKKRMGTPKTYPRRAGMPAKNPIC